MVFSGFLLFTRSEEAKKKNFSMNLGIAMGLRSLAGYQRTR